MPEIVREHGGTPVRTRVGHSFIKAEMAETGAVFGGEHSGHFYFRDFWRADSGMLAALHVLAALGEPGRGRCRQLLAEYSRYVASGEINTDGRRPGGAIGRDRDGVRRPRRSEDRPARRAHRRARRTAGGSTCGRPTPSRCCGSTSKAADEATMAAVRDEVLGLIRAA